MGDDRPPQPGDGGASAPPSVALRLDVRLIVSWYNRVMKIFRDEQLPPSVELTHAMGLVYADLLRQQKFELSDAVRAFKAMWALDAQTQSIPEAKPEVGPVGTPVFKDDDEPGQPGPDSSN